MTDHIDSISDRLGTEEAIRMGLHPTITAPGKSVIVGANLPTGRACTDAVDNTARTGPTRGRFPTCRPIKRTWRLPSAPSGHAMLTDDLNLRYEPGDYSHAAYLALQEPQP